jgi:hypothetical protein
MKARHGPRDVEGTVHRAATHTGRVVRRAGDLPDSISTRISSCPAGSLLFATHVTYSPIRSSRGAYADVATTMILFSVSRFSIYRIHLAPHTRCSRRRYFRHLQLYQDLGSISPRTLSFLSGPCRRPNLHHGERTRRAAASSCIPSVIQRHVVPLVERILIASHLKPYTISKSLRTPCTPVDCTIVSCVVPPYPGWPPASAFST